MSARLKFVENIRRAFSQPIRDLKLAAHMERMKRGCTRCGSAVPGRVCPDCYICIGCKPGHDHG